MDSSYVRRTTQLQTHKVSLTDPINKCVFNKPLYAIVERLKNSARTLLKKLPQGEP
jgi:hypothetical protein